MKYCIKCGEQITDGQKICTKCGYNLEENNREWRPNLRPIKAEKGVESSPKDFRQFPEARKPAAKLRVMKPVVVLILILCIVSSTIIGVNWYINNPSYKSASGTSNVKTMGKLKKEEIVVKEDSPIVTINGIKVDFGKFNIEGNKTLTVTKEPVIEHEEGVRISTYDIKLEDKKEFSDVVTISLPYDSKYTEEGFEEKSVCAKYYNEETKEYESIPYTVNTKNKTLDITTTHFSKYSVFETKNSYTRMAYVTSAGIGNIALKDAQEILKEYIEKGGVPGDKALETGYTFVTDSLNLASKTNTFMTLGGQLDSKFCENLDKSTRWLGLAAACVNLAVGYSNAETNEETRKAVTNAYKDMMYSTVDFLGSSAVQVQFVAVFVVDYRLNQFMTGTIDQKRLEFTDVYNYYNKKYQPMTSKQWYNKFKNIYTQNKNDVKTAQKLMDEEIDNYVNKFWTIDQDKLWLDVLADTKYKRMPYPNSDDIEYLKKECKQNLMQSLTAVFNRLELYITEQIKADYYKRLDALQKELNTVVTFKIVDDKVKGDEASQYTDYTVRFSPLSNMAKVKNWTGVMSKSGLLTTKFTVLGYMQSGSPNEIQFFKPGDDPDTRKPEITMKFKISMPETVVAIEKELDVMWFNGKWNTSYEGQKGTLTINITDDRNCVVMLDNDVKIPTTYTFDKSNQTLKIAPKDMKEEYGGEFSGGSFKKLERTDSDAIELVGKDVIFTRTKK